MFRHSFFCVWNLPDSLIDLAISLAPRIAPLNELSFLGSVVSELLRFPKIFLIFSVNLFIYLIRILVPPLLSIYIGSDGNGKKKKG